MVSAVSVTRVYVRLTDVDLGPAPDKTLFFSVSPRDGGLLSAAQAADFNSQVISRVRSLPGVQATAFADSFPPFGARLPFWKPDDLAEAPREATYASTVSHDYLSTLGIPILFGRGFAESDRSAGTPVAIVDLEMARRNWASPREAVNAQIKVGTSMRRYEVIGVAGSFSGYWARAPHANDLPLAESRSECRRHGHSSNRFIDVHHCRACAAGAWRHACSTGDVERNDATGTLAGDGDPSSSTDGRDARVGSDRSRPGRPGRVCAGGVDRRVPAAGTGDPICARRLRAGTRVAGAPTGDRRGRDGLGHRRSGNPRGATIGPTVDQRRGGRSCRADCAGLRPARFDSRVGWLRPRTIGSASDVNGMASSPLSGNSASGGRR